MTAANKAALALLVVATLACAARARPAPVFSLDASTLSSASDAWADRLTGVSFSPIGAPALQSFPGAPGAPAVRAVSFTGAEPTAYRGPLPPSSLCGRSARSIAVWAYQFGQPGQPDEPRVENTLVSWGRRGWTAREVAFNYGAHETWGAVVHYGLDMGWCRNPQAVGTWRHLTYTYDGERARVYANGVFFNSLVAALDTDCTTGFLLGAQNNESGGADFANANNPLRGVAIARAAVWDSALSGAEVKALFAEEAPRFGPQPMEDWSDEIDGAIAREAGGMSLGFGPKTGMLTRLSPRGEAFDFAVGANDKLRCRMTSLFYQFGDCTMRLGEGEGAFYTSRAYPRNATVVADASSVIAVDLTAAFARGFPLRVTRRWVETPEGRLALRFTVSNPGAKAVRVAAFGAAMPNNNDFSGRTLEDAHENCSLADPYVGAEAGWVQMVRLKGRGSAMVVFPERGTSFEAWRPLHDHNVQRGVTFEGVYEMAVHTSGWVAGEWKNAGTEWNDATSVVLAPGKSATYGFVFALAKSVATVEQTVRAQGYPLAVALPGTILHTDHAGAKLVLLSDSAVASIEVTPKGALSLELDSSAKVDGGLRTVYRVAPKLRGFNRVTIKYEGSFNGAGHTVHYYVTDPQKSLVDRVASHHEKKQWFDDKKDPFNRTYAFLPWDKAQNAMVTQDPLVYISGLSDECGAGPNLLMAVKSAHRPTLEQVKLLDKYATVRLDGGLQGPDGSIKASLFYFEPGRCPGCYTIDWGCWDYERGQTTWRAYNYPHQVAVYWSLYRVARLYEPLAKSVLSRPWDWYLRKAVSTSIAMNTFAAGLAEWGLMDGSIFLEVVRDCRREGLDKLADSLENTMQWRVDGWASREYPFGSEMPWDSTGQEEVYQWMAYRGLEEKRLITLDVVRAYTPVVAHWGYSGSARRYFDDAVYGRFPEVGRGFHHYGASLNSIVLLDSYRRDPDGETSLQMLRAGYAGANGVLGNIDENGFAAMHFFADPAYNKWEPYNGDYGSAFFGYVYNAGAYVATSRSPLWEQGRLCFGCEIVSSDESNDTECVVPRDGLRQRIFVSHLRAWVTLDSGEIERLCYQISTELPAILTLTLAPKSDLLGSAMIRFSDGREMDSVAFTVSPPAKQVRQGWQVPLQAGSTTVYIKKTL